MEQEAVAGAITEVKKEENKIEEKPLEIGADATIEVENTTTENKPKKAKEVEKPKEYVKAGTKNKHTVLAIEKPEVLTNLIKGVSELINEGEFKFTDKGLNLLSMDPANVCMINMTVPANTFLGFNRGDESNYCLNLLDFKKVLNRSKGGMIKMRFGDRLEMVLEEKNKELEFGLPLLAELENKTTKIPELNFTAEIKMKSSEFKEALSDAGLFSESVAFEIKGGKFLISSGGLSTMANLSKEASVIKGDEGTKSKYSIEYLNKQVVKGFDKVSIFFGNEYPLKIVYEKDGVMVSFITAPRVDSE